MPIFTPIAEASNPTVIIPIYAALLNMFFAVPVLFSGTCLSAKYITLSVVSVSLFTIICPSRVRKELVVSNVTGTMVFLLSFILFLQLDCLSGNATIFSLLVRQKNPFVCSYKYLGNLIDYGNTMNRFVICFVPPRGIEPPSTVPKTAALSVELRRQSFFIYSLHIIVYLIRFCLRRAASSTGRAIPS